MTITDKILLKEFRTPGKCGWCGKRCRLREPAHLLAKGSGGGGRLDIRINLIALGSTLAFQCTCHTDHHNGHRPLFEDLLALVAQRENTTQDTIRLVLDCLRRIPNRPIAGTIEAELLDLPGPAREMMRAILKQHKKAA